MRVLKLKTVLSVVSVLFLVSSYGYADDDSKTDKIKELMKIQGIYDLIKQAQISTQETLKSNASAMLQQLQSKFPTSNLSVNPNFKTALEKFLTQAGKPVPETEEAVRVWGQLYGSLLTEDDLDKILAYSRSPIGQKDIDATKKAQQEFNKYFIEQVNQHVKKASEEFHNELRTILERQEKGSQ